MKARSVLVVVSAALVMASAAQAELDVVKSDYGTMVVAGYAILRHTYQYGEQPDGFSTSTSTYAIRSASVIFKGDIFKYAGYCVYFDPVQQPSLVEAYGTFNVIPNTELKGGQFLVPLSKESVTSTSKLLFVDRSMVTVAMTPPQGRDIGVMADWKKTWDPQWLGLSLAAVNGPGLNRADDNTCKDLAFRVSGNPLPMAATTGFSTELYYYMGKVNVPDPANPADRLGIATEPRYGVAVAFENDRVTGQAEYLTRNLDFSDDDTGTDVELARGGYYVMAGYKFGMPWEWWQQLEPCVRYEAYDPNKDADDDASAAATAGLNFHFDRGHHCKLMLNYQNFMEEGDDVDNDRISTQFQVRF